MFLLLCFVYTVIIETQTIYRKPHLQATETKETNILNKRNIVKNPNWREADQLAIYKSVTEDLNSDYRETNPASDRVEALNPDLRITTPAP